MNLHEFGFFLLPVLVQGKSKQNQSIENPTLFLNSMFFLGHILICLVINLLIYLFCEVKAVNNHHFCILFFWIIVNLLIDGHNFSIK